jgi:hypothetical protein
VRNSVIANSTIRYNVEYFYSGSAQGSRNVVTENCIFGGRQGSILGAAIAFLAYANIVADARFLGSSASDLRLGATALCGLGLLERPAAEHPPHVRSSRSGPTRRPASDAGGHAPRERLVRLDRPAVATIVAWVGGCQRERWFERLESSPWRSC